MTPKSSKYSGDFGALPSNGSTRRMIVMDRATGAIRRALVSRSTRGEVTVYEPTGATLADLEALLSADRRRCQEAIT